MSLAHAAVSDPQAGQANAHDHDTEELPIEELQAVGTEPIPAIEVFPGDDDPLVPTLPLTPEADAPVTIPDAAAATRSRDATVWAALTAVAGTWTFATVAGELMAWLRTLVSAAVYATLIVTFGFQVARVEGRSMEPTLENEDRLIVNKFAYVVGAPRAGDIVMLYYPVDPDKSFVKRVIAQEGDRVKIEDGQVYVNDVALADDFVDPDFRSHEDRPVIIVKEGYYYVLGDHRNNSSDSRDWGEVPKKYIVGKVQLRWWPLTHARVF